MKLTKPILFAALAAVAAATTGCSVLKPQPDLTRFYVLRPTQPAAPRATGPQEIRVGPGRIAGYLENKRIAVQQGPHRVEFLDEHWWAEPPSKGINRVLSENLAARLTGAQLVPYPEPALADAGYEVRYAVERFEGTLAGPVTLEVGWQVVKRPAGEVLTRKRSAYKVPVHGQAEDVASYVERLSAAVAQWSDEIAASIPSR